MVLDEEEFTWTPELFVLFSDIGWKNKGKIMVYLIIFGHMSIGGK